MNNSIYRRDAKKVFDKMISIFPGDNSIWPPGNAFDTMIDYMRVTKTSDPIFLSRVLEFFYSHDSGRYDDFIWPAVASAKAFDHNYDLAFSGHTAGGKIIADLFREFAKKNWSFVFEGTGDGDTSYGTQSVWKNIQDIPNLAKFKPRFFGGAWQSDISERNQPVFGDNCSGLQLSVINGLMLVFSGMLSRINSVEYSEYSQMIAQAKIAQEHQRSFLKSWINLSQVDSDHSLFRFDAIEPPYQFRSGGLIRERVSTYAQDSEGKYPLVQAYNKDRVWAGDQGLVIQGLGYLNAANDIDTQTNQNLAIGLVRGVYGNFYSYNPAEELHLLDSVEGDWVGVCCPPCYQTGGPGIFFRGILNQLFLEDTPLRKELKQNMDLLRMIANLAKTAAADKSNGIVGNSAPNPIILFPYLDRLSVLTLAIHIEEREGISLHSLLET
uniref:hypothetical protein n=1 Tax=Roseivirga sp. TaxID=1964215 RepID=UPI0040480439